MKFPVVLSVARYVNFLLKSIGIEESAAYDTQIQNIEENNI
jgi:hypothetical protein